MKGKREFPPDVVGTGDVLSHLSKISTTFFITMYIMIFTNEMTDINYM